MCERGRMFHGKNWLVARGMKGSAVHSNSPVVQSLPVSADSSTESTSVAFDVAQLVTAVSLPPIAASAAPTEVAAMVIEHVDAVGTGSPEGLIVSAVGLDEGIEDDVMSVPTVAGVIAHSVGHEVVPGAAEQPVVPAVGSVQGFQRVAIPASAERVDTLTAVHVVVARPTEDAVLAAPTFHQVEVCSAEQAIGAAAAEQPVQPSQTAKGISAAESTEHVRVLRANEHVIAVGPRDRARMAG